jgi:hypothetical protein
MVTITNDKGTMMMEWALVCGVSGPCVEREPNQRMVRLLEDNALRLEGIVALETFAQSF